MSFERSIAELRQFAMKADASGDMRLSITFKNEGDRARFLAEINREFERNMDVLGDQRVAVEIPVQQIRPCVSP